MGEPATLRMSWGRALLVGVLLLTGLAAAIWLDRPVHLLSLGHDSSEVDWHRMLRVCGYVPVWLVVGIALGRLGARSAFCRRSPGLILIVNVVSNALVVEVLKLLLRRFKPNELGGLYSFRPFDVSPFNSSGLGLPSSHTMVAFAAAWMLWRLYPRGWFIWLTLAAGCAFVRVANHSHFVSDVYVAAVVSYFVTAIVWSRFSGAAAPGHAELPAPS